MNKQRLLSVIKATEEGREIDFNMGLVTHVCGTPACMIGHYASRTDLQSVFYLPQSGQMRYRSGKKRGWLYDDLAEHFDISRGAATDLFGCPQRVSTREEAIAGVRDFISKHEIAEAVEELIKPTKEEQHEFVQS